MVRIFRMIENLRDRAIPVLIAGGTGTGKELVARAIHDTGPRRRGPFFALHCASLPAELFESELFGYRAGAFTGAEESKAGLLEHLAGGTLFLDEVSSLSLETQAKLLRVLEARAVRPLGAMSPRPVDVRFIASSSSDLAAAVEARTFRGDLFFRLRGVEIALPPLRERREDIQLLARHFLEKDGRKFGRTPPCIDPGALRLLESYDWPGNVRELETVLTRALLTATPRTTLTADVLRPFIPRREEARLFPDSVLAGRDLDDLHRELDRAYLTRLFRETGGDIAAMARALKVKRIALYLRLKRAGIDVRALRRELGGGG
jgi:transcriptional regulator with PAS, ATPase and Fis domain